MGVRTELELERERARAREYAGHAAASASTSATNPADGSTMTWIETDSLSFTARHDDADLACAHRVLDSLEDLRLRLEDRFDQVPGQRHGDPARQPGLALRMAHPLLPAVRWSAAPAARRYLAGWPMAGEIHTLNDSWMEKRSAGEDSLRALRGTAERMYCEIVLAANNPALPPMWTPRRFAHLPALGLADRGRRAVLRRPDLVLPRRSDHAAAGGRSPGLPPVASRRSDPGRHRLRPA